MLILISFLFFRSAFDLFEQFDSTQMVFNPTIPLPKQCEPKLKKGRFNFISNNFKPYYRSMLKRNVIHCNNKVKETFFDVYKDLKSK